jgi:membrane-associated phospholipid phosphatase
MVLTQGIKYILAATGLLLLIHWMYFLLTSEKGLSFPSQHTSFAFATATALSLQYRKWWVVVPAYTWAAMVGYSRLYLGQHYPSDVDRRRCFGNG